MEKICTLTPANNPWNEIYKIAAGKKTNRTHNHTKEKRWNDDKRSTRNNKLNAGKHNTRK